MSESSAEAVSSGGSKGPFGRLMTSLKALVEPELPLEDRRLSGRLETSLEVNFVTEQERAGTGIVLDLSRRGLRLRTNLILNKGTSVAIKAPVALEPYYSPMLAQVMWSSRKDDDYIYGLLLPPGIEFEESWVAAVMDQLGYQISSFQRRKYVRADSELPGQLLLDAQPPLPVTVLNLSMGGAMVSSEVVIESDTPFRLQLGPHADLPELEVSGVILRNTPGETEGKHVHSTRFGPLEKRRHSLLKEYIMNLLERGVR